MNLEILNVPEAKKWLSQTNQVAYSSGFEKFCQLQYHAERFFIKLDEQWLLPAFVRQVGGVKTIDLPVPATYAEPLSLVSDPQPIDLHEVAIDLLKLFKADTVQSNLWSPENFHVFRTENMVHHYDAFILKINASETTESLLQNRFDKKTRNQITTALKNGFEGRFIAELTDWYTLYAKHHRMRGYPFKSLAYFENLKKAFGDQLHAFGAYLDGKLVGANLFVVNNDYVWLVSNVSDFSVAGLYPNNFLYWQLINHGISGGIKFFDFGGSATSDKGGAHFKTGFGAQAVPLYTYIYHRNLIVHFRQWLATKRRHLNLKR